jgi:hypothetical protein
VTIYHLDIGLDYDFELIGISSHEKDYRLAWSLNRAMNWKLVKVEDIQIEQRESIACFPRFYYHHPVDQSIVTLIDNKTSEGYLMPELTQFDYLLKVEELQHGLDDLFFKKLRRAQFVLAVFPLDVTKLKSKQNLIYEEEK